MNEIDGLISDFGGVLTAPLPEAFAAATADLGIPLEDLGMAMVAIAQRTGLQPLFELETGRMTEPEFVAALGTALGERLGRPVDVSDFSRRLFAHLVPNEPLIEFLRELRRDGLRMALCTNNVREWEPLWRPHLPVDELFDVVVDSGFVGHRKPDPEIYRITIERLGGDPQHMLFLDDMAINCEAARDHGLRAIHFVTTEQAIADLADALGRPTP